MAANNGGGRQGNNQMNEHVEFSVKAEEDLYLTGSENTIRRVTAETNYSCLMLKTQRFSSLFRHYAKYHGLRKDDLEYYFVNLLENEDTPESVQLQRGDTIMVRKRRKPEPPPVAADDDEFFKDMRDLLEDQEHMDAVFWIPRSNTTVTGRTVSTTAASLQPDTVGSDASDSAQRMVCDDPDDSNLSFSGNASANGGGGGVEIRAHKSVLTARGDYFKALFRTNASQSLRSHTATTLNRNSNKKASSGFRESEECVIRVEPYFTELHIRYVLEFLYTNRIRDLRDTPTDDLLCILHLSDKWLLRDLKRLVEHELIRSHLTVQSVARLYGATEDYRANRLAKACIEFIMSNLRQLAGNTAFEEEMKNYPHLCIPVLKAAAEMIPEGPVPKKARLDAATAAAAAAVASGTPSSANNAAAAGASPAVPDSDP